MLQRLIRWSFHNPLLVLLISGLLLAAGTLALLRTPLDAIPDLSDVQVIVYTDYPGQAPQVVEDQVTYPLTSALLSVPKARVVRGNSLFRITSYNVCYTKLLRPDSLEKTPRATPAWMASMIPAPAKPPVAAVGVKAPCSTRAMAAGNPS